MDMLVIPSIKCCLISANQRHTIQKFANFRSESHERLFRSGLLLWPFKGIDQIKLFRIKNDQALSFMVERHVCQTNQRSPRRAFKMFYMPDHADFGIDLPEHYGCLTYYDDEGIYYEEK